MCHVFATICETLFQQIEELIIERQFQKKTDKYKLKNSLGIQMITFALLRMIYLKLQAYKKTKLQIFKSEIHGAILSNN